MTEIDASASPAATDHAPSGRGAGDLSPSRIGEIRGVAHIAAMGLVAILIGLFFWPLTFAGPARAVRLSRVWAKASLFFLKLFCGVSYRLNGAENLPTGPAIVAANHQSMWETIAVVAFLPRPALVFKASLQKVPVYGWWGEKAGSIPIDRDGGAQSIRYLIKMATLRVSQGFQVVIFPEGSRMPVGARAPLLPGVTAVYKACGAPVTPIGHDSGRFWRHPGLERRPGVITVNVLPPIPPGLDRADFERRLETALFAARPDLDDEKPAEEAKTQ